MLLGHLFERTLLFCDFLFVVYLDIKPFQKGIYTEKGQFTPTGAFFPLRVEPYLEIMHKWK